MSVNFRKLKSISLIILLLFLSGVSIFAQQYRYQMEKLKSQRIAFFTEKLELTPAEAEKFWPVYNAYSEEKEKMGYETRLLHKDLMTDFQSLSDEKVKNSMAQYVNLQNKEHELFLEYHQKFLKILPERKVLLLYITEIQFKQFLLKKIGEERKGPGYGQGRR
jgi:hypothetical protein